MKSILRTLTACLVVCTPSIAQNYWHRVSGTIGGLNAGSGSDTAGMGTAPAVTIDYGWRFHRHAQFDAGIETAFASRSGERTNIYIPRVGYRIIVPVWQDRVEASVGFGGAHSLWKPKIGQQVWLVYGQLGANYALDPAKRYRAGFNLRWYRDPIGRPVQQWVLFGGELSYSWGR